MDKVCSKCKKEKPLEEFHKDQHKKCGYRSHCKSCIKEYKNKVRIHTKKISALYYLNNKKRINEISALYRKNNKEKEQKRHKKYYINNKSARKKYQEKYRKTAEGKMTHIRGEHNRRKKIKMTENLLTSQQWMTILGLQRYRCVHCGEYFDKVDPTKDHIIPVSKGGGLTFLNTQALCGSCNSSKNNKIIDYRTEKHKIIIEELGNAY